MNRILAVFLCLCPAVASLVLAQDPPMTWGEIPKSEIGITSYPADTAATAVILCDYGTSEFNGDAEIVYNYHVRIRILSAAGYHWGTHSVTVLGTDDAEFIRDIEGVTYTLDPEGNIVEHELDEDDVFEEKLSNGLVRYRFTLPALEPGCVIEYRYRIIAQSWYLMRDWTFQTSEPVLWSEYRMTYPRTVPYAIVKRGFHPFAISESNEVLLNLPGNAGGIYGGAGGKYWQQRWAVRNAPAIRDEPYMTSTKDYLNRVDVQLAGYAYSSGGVRRILTDWKTLVEELSDSRTFGDRIDVTRNIREAAEAQTKDITDPMQRVRTIYDWIRKGFTVTSYTTRTEQDVNDVLESRKGTSAEITFTFISLLRALGISADAAITSTRNNGAILKEYPLYAQFNRVLARVQAGPATLVVDPTDELRPMELLPVNVLGAEALVIKPGAPEWLSLRTDRLDTRKTMVAVDIRDDGSSDGWVTASYHDYAALDFRRRLKTDETKTKEVARAFLGLNEEDAQIDSVTITGMENDGDPIRLRARVSNLTDIVSAGDKLYVTPMLVNRQRSNPLRLERRDFPLDFPYLTDHSVVTTLTMPAAFRVEDTLDNRVFDVARDQMRYKRMFQVSGTLVQSSSRYEVSQTKFDPRGYREIRAFMGNMVSTQAEQFTASRIPPPPPQATPPPAPKTRTTKKGT